MNHFVNIEANLVPFDQKRVNVQLAHFLDLEVRFERWQFSDNVPCPIITLDLPLSLFLTFLFSLSFISPEEYHIPGSEDFSLKYDGISF